ncbi:MAG: DUF1294 domain-containing protein [Clostridiales bacterium]|nr:DUF1294 domain-containing protein [Oscillospiraceae bacterium]MDD5905263.1 DUF1294 domain-containing protein [Clostridiales bacterium]
MRDFLLSPVGLLMIYLVIINLIAFLTFGADKRRARRDRRRVRESTLFLLAAIGGSIGALLGMYVFRHKTRHWYFCVGIPAILILQIALPILISHIG